MILRIAAVLASLYSLQPIMASPTDQTVLGGPDNLGDFVRPEGNLPTLEDLLTLETRVSIFYSYSRETDMSARFAQKVQEGEGTTLFVPTNKAVQALARKPHEDPEGNASQSDAEHDSISKSNVQRWVGAHIIPHPKVNFTSTEPYNTLTSGATIAFKSVTSKHGGSHPAGEAHTTTDEEHLSAVKGSAPHVDTDAAHLSSIKGPAGQSDSLPAGHPAVDKDAAHLSSIKGSARSAECPRMRLRQGLGMAGRVDTDAAHFASIKGPASPDRAPQADVTAQKPIWKQYEVNDGVHIIDEKQASNGVMYMIDGTVPV